MIAREGRSIRGFLVHNRVYGHMALSCFLVLFAWAQSVGVAAAAPAPAWSVLMSAEPTNLEPGSEGQVQVLAANVGGASTSGVFEIEDQLPEGLTVAAPGPTGLLFRLGENGSDEKLSCSGSGTEALCKSTDVVGPSTDLQIAPPGEFVQMTIPVDVAPDASASVLNRVTVSGGGATEVSSSALLSVSDDPPPFGLVEGPIGLRSQMTEGDGSATTQAGGRPYQATATGVHFPTVFSSGQLNLVEGGPKDLEVELPDGFVANPNATPVRCTEEQLENSDLGGLGAGCPPESQIGVVALLVRLQLTTVRPFMRPIYNMVPPPGVAAQLGFAAIGGVFVHIEGTAKSVDGKYRLVATTRDTTAKAVIIDANASLWGNPSDPSHDLLRKGCLIAGGTCPESINDNDRAFVTMPTACADSMELSARATSWQAPNVFTPKRTTTTTDPQGNPTGVRSCSTLEFEPTLTLRPDVSDSETPAGMAVNLHIPQNENVDELATANLKDTKVTLPAGLALNPSAGGGLKACPLSGDEGINLPGLVDDELANKPAGCPAESKVGTVAVKSPLLDHPLPGAVYVAKPFDNPFNSLLGIYIAVHDPQSGIVVKLAGKVEADPQTGRLTTTFSENPQLPFEDFTLNFFSGPRAALRTPASCGTFSTEGELNPWSGAPPVHTSDAFAIARGPNGSACTTNEGDRPNSPGFEAGTLTSLAGSYSPFVLRLQRPDGAQQFKGLNLTLPPGLSGKLAGIQPCSDAALAVAGSRSDAGEGAQEVSNPSCPASSQVGQVAVSAGAGSQPYFVRGTAYLAGPYKGAPLSLAIITPAVAGPFDLGVVVVRSALRIDPKTAQLTAVSDPLPSILQGIPLLVREIRVSMNRPEFTLNPTSCDPMAIDGESITLANKIAPLSDRFQAAGCRGLEFKPSLSLKLKGGVKRADNPKLIATVKGRPGDANIGRTQVTLPHSALLDQSHIKTICTKVQFAADQCPAGSVYGRARATSPLLDYQLSGKVYLRSSTNLLPDLVADLRGPAYQPIRIELVGRTDAVNGALRNTFEVVPDAPVSKFTLELFGGKRGLVVNSENSCRGVHRATVKMNGQNGKINDLKPKVTNSNCGKGRKSK